jgi:hypothetical protein
MMQRLNHASRGWAGKDLRLHQVRQCERAEAEAGALQKSAAGNGGGEH